MTNEKQSNNLKKVYSIFKILRPNALSSVNYLSLDGGHRFVFISSHETIEEAENELIKMDDMTVYSIIKTYVKI